MAQEYTITQIKKNDTWKNNYGEFQSYSLALQGFGEAVSLNKKVPVSQEPQVGDVIYGSLELATGKSGRDYYKFKAEQRMDNQNDSPSPSQKPVDWDNRQNSIKAQFAIKTAVELLKDPLHDITEDLIEHWANIFFNMVDKVKDQLPDETKDLGTQVKAVYEDEDFPGKHFDPPELNNVKTEEVNLDEVPF